ncbi:MAG: hypothetical protein IJA34_04455 [Lachnospiraceae bacterium]|nr:hypothetical protein [Lachnospiraceae bacterium]
MEHLKYIKIYRKLVNKDECDDFKTGCIYACYKNQEIEIHDVDLKGKQFVIWTSSDHIYTDEFVENVLGEKRGRDIFAKCDIDKFTEYSMHTREYTMESNGFTTTTNESKFIVSLEEVREYLLLINNY